MSGGLLRGGQVSPTRGGTGLRGGRDFATSIIFGKWDGVSPRSLQADLARVEGQNDSGRPVSAGGTRDAGKGGRIRSSLAAGRIWAGPFSCPCGQTLVLASVQYTNIVLTDTTNNVSTNVGSVSRTFFNV